MNTIDAELNQRYIDLFQPTDPDDDDSELVIKGYFDEAKE